MKKNNIRIFRTNKSKGSSNTFTQLPNTVVDDLRLSNGAFRILVQVLRQIDFYKFHIKHYSEKMGISRTTMREYINELIHYGYCRQESISLGNVQYYWYESPELNPAYQSDSKKYCKKKKLEQISGDATDVVRQNESDDHKLISNKDSAPIEQFNNNEKILITHESKTDHPMSENWAEVDQELGINNTLLSNTSTTLNNNTKNISEEIIQNIKIGKNEQEEVGVDANTKCDVDQIDYDELLEINRQIYIAGEEDRIRKAEEEARLNVEWFINSSTQDDYVDENISRQSAPESLPAPQIKFNAKPIPKPQFINTDNKSFIGRLVQVFDERISQSSIKQRCRFAYYDNTKEVYIMAYNEKVQLLNEIKPGDIAQIEYTEGEHVLFLVDIYLLDDELKYVDKKPTPKSVPQIKSSKNPYNDMMK